MGITEKLQRMLADENKATRIRQQAKIMEGKEDAEYARKTRVALIKQEEILNGYVKASQIDVVTEEAANYYHGTIYQKFLYKVSSKTHGTWYRYDLRESDLLPDRKVSVSRYMISIIWGGDDKTKNYVEVTIGRRGWIWIQYDWWPIPTWEWKIRPQVIENRLVEALQNPKRYRDPETKR